MIGYPLDSHVSYDDEGIPQYDRAITSEPYRKLLRELFKTGVMPNQSTNMQVSAGTGMNVIVSAGFAMVNGCMKLEDENRTLAVKASSSTFDRIDTVVLRLDDNDDVRICDFYIVEGIPASSPVRPELTRSGAVYEIGLADIFITKGDTQISNSKITDTRYENARCGVISSLSEFDTSTLDQQMKAWAQEQEAEFLAWLESIKNILDESTAGHLQNEIIAVTGDLADHEADTVKHITSEERTKWNGYEAGLKVSVTGDVTAQLKTITASTTDIEAGTTALTTGQLYVVYE